MMRARCFQPEQGEARLIHSLLADDLAECREGDAADLGRHTRSAVAPTPGHRRAAVAAARPQSAPPEKPTRLRRGDMRIERIDRIGLELGTESKSRFHVEEDDPLSAVAELRPTQTVAGRMANPHRDADAAVVHEQCIPAAGKFTRLGRCGRSLSSRMGSLDSSRFHMTIRA